MTSMGFRLSMSRRSYRSPGSGLMQGCERRARNWPRRFGGCWRGGTLMRSIDRVTNDQLEAVMDAVIERGRTIQRAPDLARARLLARARATVAASHVAPAPMPATPSRWRGLRVALAASVVLSLAAAGATAALRARAAHAPEIVPTSVPHFTASSVRSSAPEASAMAPIPAPQL